MNTILENALVRAGFVRRSRSSWMSGFSFGALAGMFAGGVAALMTTPMNGREMRKQVGSTAKQLAEQTQGVIADVTSKLEAAPAAVADVSHSVKQLLSNGESSKKDAHLPARENRHV